nr:MAG TPA: hypothetical protein [Inoviridae sp.]
MSTQEDYMFIGQVSIFMLTHPFLLYLFYLLSIIKTA